MNALTAVRFVDRRTTEPRDTPHGPRIHVTEHWTDGTVTEHWTDGTVTEHWTDGTVTEHVMGPQETAAHLRHQAGNP